MSKAQKGNRESKKPKKEKIKTIAAAPSQKTAGWQPTLVPARRNDSLSGEAAQRSSRGQWKHDRRTCGIDALRSSASRSRQGPGLPRYPEQQRTVGVLRSGVAAKAATARGHRKRPAQASLQGSVH